MRKALALMFGKLAVHAQIHMVNPINYMVMLLRSKAFQKDSWVARSIRNIGVGRLIFQLRCFLAKIASLYGYASRSVEYPWILSKLQHGENALVLDIGCCGSLLSHELLTRGYRVVGMDQQERYLGNHREFFVKTNILNNNLPAECFDIILLISVIEHVGLSVYGQTIIDNDADYTAMQLIKKLLKPTGQVYLTTQYEGNFLGDAQDVVVRSSDRKEHLERRYNTARLTRLIDGYRIVSATFYHYSLSSHRFKPVLKHQLDQLTQKTCEGSIACLTLQLN